MPTRSELSGALLNFAVCVPPLDFNLEWLGFFPRAQTEMDFQAAVAGMAGAAINLGNEVATIGHAKAGDCADRGSA